MKNGEYDGLTTNTMKIPSKLTTQQRTVNTVVVKFRTKLIPLSLAVVIMLDKNEKKQQQQTPSRA